MRQNNMDSLNNFVWDCFIKSFESKDTLIEATSGFSMQEKKTFARCFFENIVLWENIYNNRVNYLLKNVKLIKKNSSIDIDKIEFHHKYGWIIFGGCLKAYLGKSSIYEGVKLGIGNGCAIGANSLVTKNCEPFGIYAGIPAKLIRYRFSKRIIEQLLDINWWSWTDEKIHKNQLFFNTDLSSFDGIVNDLIEE